MVRRFSRRALAVWAGALLLAAGCTSGGDAASGDRDSTVRLGFSAWPGWLPWQVAEEQHLFDKHGVAVKLTYFDSYTDSLTALSTGNLDANSQTLNDTLSSTSTGAAQTIVLVNDNSTGNDQIIARPGIRRVADLKGKKVAVEQGTVDHYLLLLALRKAGLAPSDIQLKPLLTDAAAAAFLAGQVDAVGAFAPFTTTALGRKGSTAIATSKDFPGAIPDHLVFDALFVKDHATQVQAIVDTWFDTLAWIAANPDKAIEIMAKKAGVSPTDYRAYDKGTTVFTREQNVAAFADGDTSAHLGHQAAQIADFLLTAQLVDEKPTTDGLLDARFVRAAKP